MSLSVIFFYKFITVKLDVDDQEMEEAARPFEEQKKFLTTVKTLQKYFNCME